MVMLLSLEKSPRISKSLAGTDTIVVATPAVIVVDALADDDRFERVETI